MLTHIFWKKIDTVIEDSCNLLKILTTHTVKQDNDCVNVCIYRNQLGKTFPELHWMCKTSVRQLNSLSSK